MGRDLIHENIVKSLYVFCSNRATGISDITGLLCSLTYSIKLHELKLDKTVPSGERTTFSTTKVFSGNAEYRNDPDSVNIESDGPIPMGKYYVIKRQSGGRLGWLYDNIRIMWDSNSKSKWLSLYAIDNKIDDEIQINGCIRSNFRMHSGTISLGCITFLDSKVFEEVRKFILETKSQKVKGADGREYEYYGILEVSAE